MSRLVFLDTETTSLDDTRGEVWEIGAIVRNQDGDTEHLWQILPDLTAADPNSLRISRFYERNRLAQQPQGDMNAFRMPADGSEPDDMIDRVAIPRVARELAILLDGAHVVGAVPDFDYRFLRRFLARWGHCWTAHYHLIDVEALMVGWLHGKAAGFAALKDGGPNWQEQAAQTHGLPWNSKALSRALGVDPRGYEAHTALGDARWARDVYDAVMGIPAALSVSSGEADSRG